MGSVADLLQLGREFVSEGYQVGENPAFGGVSPVHVSGSKHYSGEALDINFDGKGQAYETSKLNAILGRLKAAGMRIIWQTNQFGNHFNHLHADTSTGPDIGNFTVGPASPASPSKPAPSTATPAAFGLSLDEMGNTATKAVIISLAVMAGAGLVLIGVTKSAGTTAINAARRH